MTRWKLIEGQAGLGRVYFVGDGASGAIKIGFTTKCPVHRTKTLQVGNPRQIRYLASFVGTAEDEARMHDRFAAVRVRGEWFKATSELWAVVSECRRSAAGITPRECEATDQPLRYLGVL